MNEGVDDIKPVLRLGPPRPRFFLVTAERGHAWAQYNLGSMYAEGQGVGKDYVEAHKWFDLAAGRFLASETPGHELAVWNRDRAAAMMTAPQIAEAQRRAREWAPK